MAAYATVEDVEARITRTLSEDEESVCSTLLDDSAIIIDSYNSAADPANKLVVSCRMVIRALGDGDGTGVPMGATQGSMSAMGYSQSWTMSSVASVGELYLNKLDRILLGSGNAIGSYSPDEELVAEEVVND